MRHGFPRLSASVLAVAAVLTAFALTAPRDDDDGRARHSAVRTTRGAVQRLDAGEVIVHGSEETEPMVTPVTDGVGNFESTATNDSSPPGVALAAERHVIALAASTLGPLPSSRSRARLQPHRPSLGRAPPSL